MISLGIIFAIKKYTLHSALTPQLLREEQSGGVGNKRDMEIVMDRIHKMSNNYIVAEDGNIWGTDKMSKDEIKLTIKFFENSDYNHKEIMIKILNEWLDDDYSNSVQIHNLAWNYLDGTVGYANKLKGE